MGVDGNARVCIGTTSGVSIPRQNSDLQSEVKWILALVAGMLDTLHIHKHAHVPAIGSTDGLIAGTRV